MSDRKSKPNDPNAPAGGPIFSRPPKPVNQMTDAELDAWADEVYDALLGLEGSPDPSWIAYRASVEASGADVEAIQAVLYANRAKLLSVRAGHRLDPGVARAAVRAVSAGRRALETWNRLEQVSGGGQRPTEAQADEALMTCRREWQRAERAAIRCRSGLSEARKLIDSDGDRPPRSESSLARARVFARPKGRPRIDGMRLSFHPGEFGRRLRLDVERWAHKSQAHRSYFIVDLDALPDCYLQIVRLNGRLHVEIGSVDRLTGETRLSPAVCDRLSELGFVRHSESGNFLCHVPPPHPQSLASSVVLWFLAAYSDLPQVDWATGRSVVLDCGFPNLFDRDEYRRWMEDCLAFDRGMT